MLLVVLLDKRLNRSPDNFVKVLWHLFHECTGYPGVCWPGFTLSNCVCLQNYTLESRIEHGPFLNLLHRFLLNI